MPEKRRADMLVQIGVIQDDVAEMAGALLRLQSTLESLKKEIDGPVGDDIMKDVANEEGSEIIDAPPVRLRRGERKHRFGVLVNRKV